MSELSGDARLLFEKLNEKGHAANRAGDFQDGLGYFSAMEQLADEAGDDLKRLHALNPAAKSLWSMERYDAAQSKLETAETIGEQLGLRDEAGIARSNIGRIAATRIIRTIPVAEQAEALRQEAVPAFKTAYESLKGHPHLYYRYAEAQHGSVVSALAGERAFALRLIADGLRVAFRKSEEPYDQKPTYKVNPRGLAQMATALALAPFGNHTPVVAKLARQKMIG